MAAGSRSGWLRAATWVLHVALPVLGLWLLYTQPGTDVRWENHHAHFGLVLGMSAISVALALQIGREALRRDDARLLLIAQSFGLSAGFLAVHAIATPAVVVDGKNAAFDLALPVGLALAAIPALASALELGGERGAALLRNPRRSWAVVAALVAGATAASLAGLGPLGDPLASEDADTILTALAAAGGLLYLLAAARYYRRFREQPGAVLLSVITAFVLLAEALLTTALARNWQLSWWEWHVLLIAGYAFVAYTVHNEHRREGDGRGLFSSIALEQTVRDLRAQYNAALEGLVDAIRDGADRGEPVAVGRVRAALAARFDLTERQGQVLERAAESLAADRDQIRALDALVEIGGNARIGVGEHELLALADRLVRGAFPRDDLRLGLLDDGTLRRVGADGGLEPWPEDAEEGERFALAVQGRPAGIIEIRRAGELSERERSVLASLASQLATALENARLYVQLDGLFRSYLSPEVASSLLADPGRAALGGTMQEVTVLMADLQGFTPFSERSTPAGVVAMLNTYWGATVPVILAEGGTITQFVGDAVMALFGAPAAQPDHARRAARAALALQAAADDVLADHPDWLASASGSTAGRPSSATSGRRSCATSAPSATRRRRGSARGRGAGGRRARRRANARAPRAGRAAARRRAADAQGQGRAGRRLGARAIGSRKPAACRGRWIVTIDTQWYPRGVVWLSRWNPTTRSRHDRAAHATHRCSDHRPLRPKSPAGRAESPHPRQRDDRRRRAVRPDRRPARHRGPRRRAGAEQPHSPLDLRRGSRTTRSRRAARDVGAYARPRRRPGRRAGRRRRPAARDRRRARRLRGRRGARRGAARALRQLAGTRSRAARGQPLRAPGERHRRCPRRGARSAGGSGLAPCRRRVDRRDVAPRASLAGAAR
jgi:class 3 adenylate cyclase